MTIFHINAILALTKSGSGFRIVKYKAKRRDNVLGNQKLDEHVINVISNSGGCIHKTDAFVGDKVYKISIFEAEKEQEENCYYIAAAYEEVLLTIGAVRSDLDENSAARMGLDLVKRMETAFDGTAEVSAVRSETEESGQPVIIKVRTDISLTDNPKKIKIICSDITDWLDELTVMKSAKVSQKQAESYQQEYEKIMSANLIPHDNEEPKDFSYTMSIISAVFAVISVFFYQMCVFPVITIVAGAFSGYRCFKNKNNIALVICLVSVVVGIIFAYVGWQEFFNSMKK